MFWTMKIISLLVVSHIEKNFLSPADSLSAKHMLDTIGYEEMEIIVHDYEDEEGHLRGLPYTLENIERLRENFTVVIEAKIW